MSRQRLVTLLLTLGTLIVFLPAGWFGFVNFDDTDYVTNNNFVKNGLTVADIRWAITTFHACNWHPLTWISHMTDCALFGLNPGAQHCVNVLFHAINVALLFTLLRRLTNLIWPSALVAALFAWHPLHVESVAWISERKDVLSTFFALLALLSYVRYAQKQSRVESRESRTSTANPALGPRPSTLDYSFALIFFALGLMSKPMLVTLPFVMLLLDFWPLQRFSLPGFRFSLLSEKIPFFLLTTVSCIVTFLAQLYGESVAPLARVSLGYRLENAPVAVVSYLWKLFWPANLCAFYPMPEKIPAFQICAALAALLLISFAAWRWRQSRPYFLVGWLWFLGTLVPVIGLVQVGGQAMADRYAYIPSIGFFIAVVFLGNEFAERMQTPKIIRFGFAGLICCACIVVTENQLPFWRDSEALFRRAAAVTQNNDLALLDLGVALDAQGRFEEALAVYHQAEKSGSGRYQIYNNLGNVLGILGRHDESLAEYRKAMFLAPDIASLHNGTGGQLAALNRFDEALKEFSTAEKLNPTYAAPHLENAKVLFKMGRDAEGLDEFHAALQIDPDNYQAVATVAHYLAANENAAASDGKNALVLAIKANDLSGRVQPMVFDILGMALAENGDFTNAIACEQNALDLAGAAGINNIGQLKTRLELYKNKLPWRESFRATNAP
jgi:tetratricopeptide (TPR) repeat protein